MVDVEGIKASEMEVNPITVHTVNDGSDCRGVSAVIVHAATRVPIRTTE
jgi:hypothetical protein